MQRNSIARQLPWEIREVVCRMRFDGAGTAAIVAAVQTACRAAAIKVPRIYGATIVAYARSDEFQRYCDRRRQWDDRMEPRRWAAAMLNEGKGPQTVADLAELEILEQLHDLAAGGLLATGKDVATVARAITALQRTQLARRQEDAEKRIAAIEAEHAAQVAEYEVLIRELKAGIERLKTALIGAGVDPDAEPADKAGGLSPAALKQIEEQAKLL